MKTLISIIILAFTLTCLGQGTEVWKDSKPEKQEYRFPEGYNPDGRIGSLALTLLAGYTSLSSDWTGYHLNGRLDYPLDGGLTLFMLSEYMSVRSNDLPGIADYTSFDFSIGLRVFGGMK